MLEKFIFWYNHGFNPKIIYDIGANHGDWTREMKKLYSESSYHLFEAFEENNKYNTEASYHNVLLSKEDNKIVDFHCIKEGFNTGNSMYLELSGAFNPNNYYTIQKKTRTLDSYIEENNIPLPDFIKIDVQGAELDVLDGGKNCLENSTMVLLEVSIHQYNKDSPLFADVIHYMNKHNFVVIDMIENHIINGYLAQVDLLFAKKDSNYLCKYF